MFEDAKKENPQAKPGDEIKIDLEHKQDFGRIAAQTAKQVIIQKIREAEKETIFADFKLKEGEIISGTVQRIEGRSAYMDIGKTTGILNREEQVPGEFYRPGQRLKAFVLKVEQTSKGPIIFLSRAYPKFVSKLFELEVPEISAGQVLVKSIAREPGSRTKIAMASTVSEIDPIGAAVGQRGTRVSAVINELGGEKIDIVEYSDDTQKYITNALSPAKIMEVRILPKNRALAVVPDDQLSLAIGKDGQNVRLAAKLTGWKIDVRSPENLGEALAKIEQEIQEETAGGGLSAPGDEITESEPQSLLAGKEEKVETPTGEQEQEGKKEEKKAKKADKSKKTAAKAKKNKKNE
jgi:N utilization substance protein A